MSSPSISVVIPAYNAGATIQSAIDSVINQTESVTEIIVVDDGSTDDLVSIVDRYGSSVSLIRQPNSRSAAARNRGIAAASSDFVAFLDADDFWEADKIERQLAVLKAFPDVEVLGSRFYTCVPGNERQLPPLRRPEYYDQALELSGSNAFVLGTMLWTGTVMVQRSVLQNSQFVSGLEPAEDRDLWVRLAASHRVYLDSKPHATAVLEPNGISRNNIALDCQKMLEVVERNNDMLGMIDRLFWKSYVRYRWAAIESSPSISLSMLARSFIGWPMSLAKMPGMKPWGRLKRLIVVLASVTKGKRYLCNRSFATGIEETAI